MSSPSKLGRHRRDQALGELDRSRVQVPEVDAEQPRLVGDRPADTRVCVADDRDVVVGVDVRPAGAVGQGRAAAADEMHRVGVGELGQRVTEHRVATPVQVGGVGRCAGTTEPPGDLVRAELRELAEHAERHVVPGPDVRRVLRVVGCAPVRDAQRDRRADGDRVAERGQLLRLERHHGAVAVEEAPQRPEESVPRKRRSQRAERCGDVEDDRRVREVAEVDDAGDLLVVDEQVVERDVAVHHLSAQRRPHRGDPLLEAGERFLDEAAGRGVVDVLGEPAGLVALLDVPQQLAPGSRMEEAAQRTRRTGCGRAAREDRRRVSGRHRSTPLGPAAGRRRGGSGTSRSPDVRRPRGGRSRR